MNSAKKTRSNSLKSLKLSSPENSNSQPLPIHRPMRKVLYRGELSDTDCIPKCKIIRKQNPRLLSFSFKMYKSDLSTFTNFQEEDDIQNPQPHEVTLKWFRSMKILHKFELFLTEDNILDTTISQFAHKGLKHMKLLRSITLYLSGKDVTNTLISEISQNLKYAHKLKAFSLDVTSSQVTDWGVNYLTTKALNRMRNLRKIDLGLGGNPLTDRSILAIINEALVRMKHIKDFSLCTDRKSVV